MDYTMCSYQFSFNVSIFHFFSIKETTPFTFPTIAGVPSVVTPQILLKFKHRLTMTLTIRWNIFSPVVLSFSETKPTNYYVMSNVALIPFTKIAT